MGPVRLELPARPEYVGVVRLALASLARNAGVEEERVDDLKIAVSEVCTDVVATGSSGSLQINWSAREGAVEIDVSGPGPTDLERRDFSRDLLSALLDVYEVENTPTGTVTRMRIG
jgi:anti-sigma regulatory factor (Ser/Thr protein kinase)